jgi:hypothetical protein
MVPNNTTVQSATQGVSSLLVSCVMAIGAVTMLVIA